MSSTEKQPSKTQKLEHNSGIAKKKQKNNQIEKKNMNGAGDTMSMMDPDLDTDTTIGEIGRGSCRERVL